MRNTTHQIAALALALWGGLGAVCSQAEPLLVLEASLPQETLLNVPVAGMLHFVNVQQHPVTIAERPRARLARLEIRDAGSKEIVHTGRLCSGFGPALSELVPPEIVPPGGRYSVRVELGFYYAGADGEAVFRFPRAGDYLVSFQYALMLRHGDGAIYEELVSNPVPLRIGPADEDEVRVWAKIPRRDYCAFSMDFAKHQPTAKDLERLAAIVRDHPQSRYSHYLALALGRHYRDESYRRGGGQGSEAEFREYQGRALRYFRQAAEMNQVPWVREEAFVEWSRFLGHRGQPREAIQIARRALEIFPQGVFRDQLIELAQMPVENPVAAAERELAAAGYDYTDLTETQVAELRAFMFSRDDAWKEQKHDPGQEDAETARRMKQWITTNLKPKDVAFVPNPFDAMNQELADLGYDLRSLDEPTRQRFSDYVDEGLNKLTAERKVSDLEWQTEMARLMKEWALANLKPTLPPKTNDTSPLTAPVEP